MAGFGNPIFFAIGVGASNRSQRTKTLDQANRTTDPSCIFGRCLGGELVRGGFGDPDLIPRTQRQLRDQRQLSFGLGVDVTIDKHPLYQGRKAAHRIVTIGLPLSLASRGDSTAMRTGMVRLFASKPIPS